MTTAIDLRADIPALECPPGLLAELLGLSGLLGTAESGVRAIHTVLDRLATLLGLEEAVVVLPDTPIGRQVFRRRWQAPVPAELRRTLAAGPPGLHTVPAVTIDPAVRAYVTDLCAAALRLDLLRHDASTDPLTGLLNRRSYEAALAEAISRTRRYGWPFALVMIDLDHFKAVNDRYGHAAGDDALRTIGREVRGVLRQGDVAARLGGDEFALIVANAGSPEDLEPLTQRLRAALARAVPEPGLGFSAGVACFPTDAADADRLSAVADARMYAGKSAS